MVLVLSGMADVLGPAVIPGLERSEGRRGLPPHSRWQSRQPRHPCTVVGPVESALRGGTDHAGSKPPATGIDAHRYPDQGPDAAVRSRSASRAPVPRSRSPGTLGRRQTAKRAIPGRLRSRRVRRRAGRTPRQVRVARDESHQILPLSEQNPAIKSIMVIGPGRPIRVGTGQGPSAAMKRSQSPRGKRLWFFELWTMPLPVPAFPARGRERTRAEPSAPGSVSRRPPGRRRFGRQPKRGRQRQAGLSMRGNSPCLPGRRKVSSTTNSPAHHHP